MVDVIGDRSRVAEGLYPGGLQGVKTDKNEVVVFVGLILLRELWIGIRSRIRFTGDREEAKGEAKEVLRGLSLDHEFQGVLATLKPL